MNINDLMPTHVPRNKNMIVRLVKNGINASIQLIGVMMALVGANLITSYLTPVPVEQQQQLFFSVTAVYQLPGLVWSEAKTAVVPSTTKPETSTSTVKPESSTTTTVKTETSTTTVKPETPATTSTTSDIWNPMPLNSESKTTVVPSTTKLETSTSMVKPESSTTTIVKTETSTTTVKRETPATTSTTSDIWNPMP
ncbi:uncharacterized protein LOC129572732 [Sitodiplosis mosellana]|uniref:uncharacterized protein LOC129572732 n=1 Tax=Sitodiplosis mosellana TaxID=263140 RepID=UPI002443DEE3|nr:uncharacterized protein LOC129572732 [Sitodiplosis mosellana]